jgi:hypothetical protein
MSGGIEAVGEVATGSMFARAAEPRAGEHAATHGGEQEGHRGLCLNCGTRLVGEHCHACGQAGHVHRTAGAILHDIGHGVFHFEGKAWRTLPMLLLHPGSLTRRYIAGERARFVSPIALFLFSVFLMFAVVANLPLFSLGNGEFLKGGLSDGVAEARVQLEEQRKKAQEDIADLGNDLREERADTPPDTARIARLERRLADTRQAARQIATAEQALPLPTTFNVKGAPPPSSDNWLDARFRHAKENPKLLLYKVKSSAYKFSWALIPLSVPFLWLLFPFSRRFGLYDHAVFATYSLTFMSLLTILLAMLAAIGTPGWILITAASIVPPIHIYKQMKGAYSLGRISALARTAILLGFISWAILPAFVLGLVYLGVAD